MIEYDVVSDAGWNTAMADQVQVRLEPDEQAPRLILITGTCPRCGHGTAHVEPVVTTRALDEEDDIVPGMSELIQAAAERAGATLRERDVDMPCGCATAHPGAPGGASGCGAHWSLHLEWGV